MVNINVWAEKVVVPKSDVFYRKTFNCKGEELLFRVDTRYVYKITCKENGKSYIGSSKNPKLRMESHIQLLRAGKHSSKALQSDFDKYGADSFDVSVIGFDFLGSGIEKIMQREFKTYMDEYGYNNKDPYWKKENRCQGSKQWREKQ